MSDEKPAEAGAEGSPEATQPGHPVADTAEPEPTAGPAPADTPPSKRAGVFIPVWAAAALAVVLVFGLGFLIGWIAAPGGGEHGASERIGRVFPGLPGRPGGGRLGNGGPTGGLPLPQGNQAFLGIQLSPSSSGQSGASVAAVETASPADQAGLKAGDVITAVDGNAVSSPQQLVDRIRAHQPGDQLTIAYTRGGSSAQASVKLGTRAGISVPSTVPQTPS